MASRDSSGGSAAGDSIPVAFARWEWRSFDYQPDLWQAALGSGRDMTAGSLSSETYLLLPGSVANVKVRNARLEIKELVATALGGLQQWRPILKAAFPMHPTDVASVLSAWHRQPVGPIPVVRSTEELVQALRVHLPELEVIPVRKWRRRYQVGECQAERATILARGEVLESLAFEHENPEVLRRTLQAHGLGSIPNTSYPDALSRLTNGRPDTPVVPDPRS